MKKLKLMNVLLVLFLLVTLVGCSGGNSDGGQGGGDTPAVVNDTVNIVLTTAPVGLHPLKTNDAPSTYVTAQMFETLYRRTMDGTSYVPLLAAELPIFSEDGKTATIKLRNDVKFHDGTPFTAAAVAYMIDSLKDPNYGSQRPSIVESIESYNIVDDYTIDLNLAYEDGVLTAKLAHTNGSIVNPALDQSQDLLVNPAGAGTGPYKYVSSVTGDNYVLEANPDYYGTNGGVGKIVYNVVQQENTAISRLKTGEADFIPTIAADSFNEASQIDGYTAVSTPSSAIMYMAMRSSAETAVNPLMANLDFRKMILEAIDIPTYTTSMMGGHATYAKSIVGPTLVGYTPAMDDFCITYNFEDAKAICDANNWAGQKVVMLVPSRDGQSNFAAYVQDQLTQLGLEVEVKGEEWGTFLDDAKKDAYCDFTVLTWSNVTGDGQQMLEPNFSTKNGVRLKWNNAEFDAYVQASTQTSVMAEREANMLEAVKLIQGQAIVSPIYSTNALFCYNSNKLSNVGLDKGGMFYVYDWVLNK